MAEARPGEEPQAISSDEAAESLTESENQMNSTIEKFGYPETLIQEYEHWVVLARPKQVTAGSMILACREEATSMGDVSEQAWQEVGKVAADLEDALEKTFDFQKINYLALMMVDPHVHFHVIPRYDGNREFEGMQFSDPGWPKHPDMKSVADLTDEQFTKLVSHLRSNYPEA